MIKFTYFIANLILIAYGSGMLNSILHTFIGIRVDITPAIFIIFTSCYSFILLKTHYVELKTYIYKHIEFSPYHVLFTLPIVLSFLGAFRLNNGYSGDLVAVNIFLILVLIVWSLYSKLEKYFTYLIYTSSLAILYMTSLRSWYVSGHDSIREFSVFLLTKQHGYWSMEWLRDAYNACLSITILPNILQSIFPINEHLVFKILFPLILSLVPLALYQLLRSKFNDKFSLIATYFFIVFPAYYQDITMLNRQGLAMFFYILFINELLASKRNIYKFLFFIGVILSHYSSGYLLMAVIIITYILQSIMRIFNKKLKIYLSLNEILVYTLIIYFWAGLITNTLSGPFRTIYKSYQLLSESTKSNQVVDVNYSLFKSNKVSESENIINIVNKSRIDKTIEFEANKYLFTEKQVPLTNLGIKLNEYGFNSFKFIKSSRSLATIIYQIIPIMALSFVLFIAPIEYFIPLSFSIGFMSISAIFVFFPSISKDYGLLRLYLQSYPVYSLISLWLFFWVFKRLKSINAYILIYSSTFIFIVIYLSNLGFFTSMLGGYNAQFHLMNSGNYYNRLYTHKSDLMAITWAKGNFVKLEAINTPAHTAILAYNWFDMRMDSKLLPNLIKHTKFITLIDYSASINSYSQSFIDGQIIPHKIYMKDYLQNSIIYSLKYSVIFN